MTSVDNPILAFKAGRATRQGQTDTIVPSEDKGAICVYKEDDFIHFAWKNRTTNEVEDDLVLIPEDATFTKLDSVGEGRVYILKFNSSDDRHFFWMQSESSARDEEFAYNINTLINDPDAQLSWTHSQVSSSSVGAVPTTASPTDGSAYPQPTAEQLAQLQNLVRALPSSDADYQDISLTDVLTPANILPLFTSHPELIPTLFPHLPPDLPVEANEDVVRRLIQSPQFRSQVAQFDQALRTGLLGGLVRGLGLPEEAGTSVHAFLRAVQDQSK